MPTLLVMRHAKSSWTDAVEDHARPLNARGRRAAVEMGERLRAAGLVPDLALVSDARRTRETWDGLLAGLDVEVEARWDPRLYLPTLSAMVEAVQRAPAVPRLLVLSHNPACEVFTGWLTGQGITFLTATVAEIALDHPFEEGGIPSGQLLAVHTPEHPEP